MFDRYHGGHFHGENHHTLRLAKACQSAGRNRSAWNILRERNHTRGIAGPGGKGRWRHRLAAHGRAIESLEASMRSSAAWEGDEDGRGHQRPACVAPAARSLHLDQSGLGSACRKDHCGCRNAVGPGPQGAPGPSYDLLLYEAGGFFLPHRDGEKLDRMVATLVVVLPSKFEGGELVVRHEGQEQTVDFAGADSQFQIGYAAFYADCEHEVRPLKSGHRLCLIYNLALAKANKPPKAPRRAEHVAKITDILREWKNDAGAPRKLAVTLGHQYTQDGLAWDALKGVDRARASILAEAAGKAGCMAQLALLTLWESGGTEDGDYSPRGYGRRWQSEPREPGTRNMSEIYDTSLTAEHWRGPAGDRPPFGKLPVERYEIVPPESLMQTTPEEQYEGYTGNEGMTLERWYRHGAVFLWPRERHLEILCQAGSPQTLPTLGRMIAEWKKADGQEAHALKEECVKFAGMIMATWPAVEFRTRRWSQERDDPDGSQRDPISCLRKLDDPELLRSYLREVLGRDASLELDKSVAKSIVRHGWTACRADLLSLLKTTSRETLERNIRLLEQFCAAQASAPMTQKPDAIETCRKAAKAAVTALLDIDVKGDSNDWRAAELNRPAILAALTRALLLAELDEMLAQVIEHVGKFAARYPLRSAQLPALAELTRWLKENLNHCPAALSQWVVRCRDELAVLSSIAPPPPADFRRDADIECKCIDCAELKRFLLDPPEELHGFQMAETRRKHLRDSINDNGFDLTCKTDKNRRPFNLVCAKNTKSYDRKLSQYHEDLEQFAAMRSLEKLLESIDADGKA